MHSRSQRVTVAVVYPALPPSLSLLSSSPSSLSCCVSLPTNVRATVGRWLILVCLAKCPQDVCLGCRFPPLAHPCSPHVLKFGLWRLQPCPSSRNPKFEGVPELTKIFFSDQSHFPFSPSHPPCAVCLVCAGGVWWEEVLTQHWGL